MSLLKITLLSTSILLLAGCSVFQTYPAQMQNTRIDLAQNKPQAAIKHLPHLAAYDQNISNLELGRLQQLSGQYQASLATFNKVIADVESEQLQAKFRVSRILENTAALLTNDNIIPYIVPAYQVVLLYQYQALNYLALGNQVNALVMLRKAQIEQSYLAQEYYKELLAAQNAANQQSYQLRASAYPKQYSAMMTAASQIKNSFLNPSADYMASLLYAASGDLNNAIVSQKNALQTAPNNAYLRSALLMNLQLQGGNNQLPQYLRAFGLKQAPPLLANSGTLAVIYEQGLIPAMQEVQVPVPFYRQMLMVAFPFYSTNQEPAILPLVITTSDGKTIGSTALLTNNFLLAEKALTEQYPMIILRIILRLGAEYGVSDINHRQNAVASIGIMLYSFITAHADLRSWLTLPDNVQILQVPLASGEYTLHIRDSMGMVSTKLQIKTGAITLLWVMGEGAQPKVLSFNL